ncbi:MAG: hypothetical protein GXP11_07720 [Gammaproteobacteria bacterium]|nr:hypothetical protein [Gammaproteobacteria bacterium]
MNRWARFLVVLVVVVLSGCTNFIYHGTIMAEDMAGTDRKVLLYWPKTEPLLGAVKAGPASLITECGETLTFSDRPQGVIYRGSPDRDQLPGSTTPVDDGTECGRIENLQALKQFEGGDALLTIRCEPLAGDDFSVVSRTRIRPSEQPYRFEMQEEKQWSLLGAALPPPSPPECRESSSSRQNK